MKRLHVLQLLRYDPLANVGDQTSHIQVMHPSFRVAHKPLISFIGKRQWPPGPQPQRPHPAAPTQIKGAFSHFLEKYNNFSFPSTSASNGRSSGRPIFNEFWEAPEHLWRPKVRNLEDSEIDAVLSGGRVTMTGGVQHDHA